MQDIGLSYDKIKQNLIEFLKKTDEFKDYNYTASGISTLIGLLAYNTHYIGYYVKMLLNEAFVDSAKLKESLMSKAKLVGYIPKNVKAATAELFVKITLPNRTDNGRFLIPRGTKFSASNLSGMKKIFTVLNDFVLKEETLPNGEYLYKNPTNPPIPLIVYEGILESRKFIVNNNIINQRFILPNKNIDLRTVIVKLYETEHSTVYRILNKASFDDYMKNNNDVYFISTNEDGLYELFFGNGVKDSTPINTGNVIEVEYLVSSGEEGNGVGLRENWICEMEAISGRGIEIDTDYEKPVASGGVNEETIESLRFSIPNHYRRQNRIVTEKDYKTLLLSEYNNIDSINVWGGERSYRKEFGKVFVCIKPKYAQKLSDTVKNEIKKNLLQKYGVVGIDIVFVDPDFIKINLDIEVIWNRGNSTLSKSQLENIIANAIKDYNRNKLNVFESTYSEVDLLSYIKSKDQSIHSLYATKTLTKDIEVKHENNPEIEIIFGNEILNTESSTFKYSVFDVKIVDKNGKLYIVLTNDPEKLVIPNSIGDINYTDGVLKLRLPKLIMTLNEDNKGDHGILKFIAKPKKPDINTFMNNIVTIDKFEIRIKDV